MITGTFEVGGGDDASAYTGGGDSETLQPDGRMAGSRYPFTGTVELAPPLEVGIYDHGVFEAVYSSSERPYRQATGVGFDGSALVWLETTSTDLYFEDWWVKSYNAGKVVTVARSGDLGYGGVLPYNGDKVLLVGDTVYWSAATPIPGTDSGRSVILAKKIDGSGKIKTIATNAYPFVSDGGGKLYFASEGDNGGTNIKVATPGGEATAVFDSAAPPGDAIDALAADPTHLAWSVSNPDDAGENGYTSWLYVKDLADGRLTEITLSSDGAGDDALFVSGGYVVWGSGSGNGDAKEYVANLDTQSIEILADCPGYSYPAIAYPAITWASPGRDGLTSPPPPTTTVGFLPH